DIDHNAGTLSPEGPGVAGVHPKSVEDIAEVEAGSMDSDAHLAMGKRTRGVWVWDQSEAFESALRGNIEAPGRGVGRDQHLLRTQSCKSRDEDAPIPDGDLRLRKAQRGGQNPSRRITIVDVEEDDRPVRILDLRRADQPPERRVDEVGGVFLGPRRN